MHRVVNLIHSDLKYKYSFLGLIVLLSLSASVSLAYDFNSPAKYIVVIVILFFIAILFQKYYKQILIISLFFGGYYQVSLRVQVNLVIAFMLIVFFITASEQKLFNNLKLPRAVKYSAALIISAVYLSSLATPYISFTSVYFASLFLVFSFCAYIIFRSMADTEEVDKLLYLFVIMTFISGIIILVQIFITGYLRSTGITQYAIMDMSVIALIIILFRDFLLSKPSKKSFIFASITFIILITTQSRFAWLGFLLTLIYGLSISYIYSKGSRKIIESRFPIFILVLLIGVALFFILGLQSIFFSRVGDISFSFFQNQGEGELVANSLESRILIWIVAINTFLQHPLTGVGYMMFSEVSFNYNILPDIFFNSFVEGLDAHTTYLNFLCETGIIGLTSFVIYLIVLFKLSFKSIRISQNLNELKVSIVLNLLVFFIMIHSIYSGAFTFGQNALHMHIILGLVVANYVILKNKYHAGITR